MREKLTMKLSEITDVKWEKGEEWFDKWYNTELEFIAFSKGAIPLVLSNHSLNSIALNTRYFYKHEDIWGDDIKNAVKEGSKFLKKIIFETERFIDQVKQIIKNVENSKIVDNYILGEVKKGLLILWDIFHCDLGESLSENVKERLVKGELSQRQIEEVMDYCFNFKHPLGYQKEEDDLRKIYLLINKKYNGKKIRFEDIPNDIKKLLDTHCEQYQYLTAFDLDTEPYTIRDFFNRLYGLPIRTPVRISKLPQKAKELLSKETVYFLKLVHRHIFLDNYAADLYAKLDYLMSEDLSKRFDISFPDLSYYSFEELERLVEKGLKLNDKDLEERKRYRVMVQIRGKIEFFYGKKVFEKIKSIIDNTKLGKVGTIYGIVASLGIAKGLVKIVKSRKNIGKVKLGDILVAPTTHPDLMLAIRRCAAIITDSGGITSHAAIISRELKIPCIVGTKIATQVLKDGDLVEVDANKGIVRVLR